MVRILALLFLTFLVLGVLAKEGVARPPSQDPLESLFLALNIGVSEKELEEEITKRNLEKAVYVRVHDRMRLGWEGKDLLGEGKPTAYLLIYFDQRGVYCMFYEWNYGSETKSRTKGVCL